VEGKSPEKKYWAKVVRALGKSLMVLDFFSNISGIYSNMIFNFGYILWSFSGFLGKLAPFPQETSGKGI
jgi:hypothetical protein